MVALRRDKAVEESRESPLLKPRLTTKFGMLYQADCLELLGTLPADAIHCIFADPPFNLGNR